VDIYIATFRARDRHRKIRLGKRAVGAGCEWMEIGMDVQRSGGRRGGCVGMDGVGEPGGDGANGGERTMNTSIRLHATSTPSATEGESCLEFGN